MIMFIFLYDKFYTKNNNFLVSHIFSLDSKDLQSDSLEHIHLGVMILFEMAWGTKSHQASSIWCRQIYASCLALPVSDTPVEARTISRQTATKQPSSLTWQVVREVLVTFDDLDCVKGMSRSSLVLLRWKIASIKVVYKRYIK